MERLQLAELDSPIGRLRLVATPAGLAYVELPRANGRGLAAWRRRFAPRSEIGLGFAACREAARQLLEYLEGKRTRFDLALDLRATPFQRRVLEAVSEVPYGETRSYGEIARAIGQPRAQRAVGAANAANPLPLVIPCHRVVAAGGKLGGYGGGRELKAQLLAMERARRPGGGVLL